MAIAAGVFGVATMLAGSRVLAGSDPGYVVFRPLLLFNTAMGGIYLVTAALVFLDERRGRSWTRAVFMTNLAVLVALVVLFAAGRAIAVDSLVAMSFRTAVWGGFLLLLSPPRGSTAPG